MITPFTFVFFRGKGIISRIIKWITNGRYSHLALFVDHIHLFETDWKFPSKIRHTKYSSEDYDLYELTFELTENDKQKLMEFIHRELNRPYDFKFLWRRLFYILFGITPKHSELKYTCDELIFTMFKECLGIELIDNRHDLTPENLARSKWLRKVK